MKQNQLNRIEQGIARLEAKLDALLAAVTAEDDEQAEQPQLDLDGNPVGAVERQAGESLD